MNNTKLIFVEPTKRVNHHYGDLGLAAKRLLAEPKVVGSIPSEAKFFFIFFIPRIGCVANTPFCGNAFFIPKLHGERMR